MLSRSEYRYVGKHRTPSTAPRRIATGTLVAGSAMAAFTPVASAQDIAVNVPASTFTAAALDKPVTPAVKLTLADPEPDRDPVEADEGNEKKKDKKHTRDDEAEVAEDLSVRDTIVVSSRPSIDYKSLGSSQASMSNMFASIAQMQERLEAEQAAAEEAARPKVASPAAGAFTSGFGPRWGTFHAGIDIANAEGTPILSVMDGVVLESGPASGYGNWIRVKHDDGSVAIYGHMSSLYVSAGQYVKAGETIAGMGNLGFSTGTHLHFEIHSDGYTPVDPVPWFSARGVYF